MCNDVKFLVNDPSADEGRANVCQDCDSDYADQVCYS